MSNQVVIFFQLLPVCDWLWIINYYPFLINDFTFISYLKINDLFLIRYFSMASWFIHNITLKKKVHTIAHAIYIYFCRHVQHEKNCVHTVHQNETILLMLMQMFYKNLYFSHIIFLYYASAVIPAIFQYSSLYLKVI